MTAPVVERPERPVLVFDGDCGFCTAVADWLARGWHDSQAVPWQELGPERLAAFGLTRDASASTAWWVDEHGAAHGHDALAHALVAGDGWRPRAGRLLLAQPLLQLGRAFYPVVTRMRRHLPGTTPACIRTARSPSGSDPPSG